MLLFVAIVLVSCGGNDMSPEKAFDQFSKQIENGRVKELTLTIYYINPSVLTPLPWSIDFFVYGSSSVENPKGKKDDANGAYDQKFVIDGNQLEEHSDLLKKISSDVLVPTEQKSYVDVRIYYMFEKNNRKIFDVAMWGGDNIFVNGIEVEENEIFYAIIMPFLSKDAAKALETFLENGKRF